MVETADGVKTVVVATGGRNHPFLPSGDFLKRTADETWRETAGPITMDSIYNGAQAVYSLELSWFNSSRVICNI